MRATAIVATACRLFGVTEDELTGPRRTQRISRARCAVAWALRQHDPHHTLASIGVALGRRHHTSIRSAIARAATLAQRDAAYARKLARLWPGS